MFVALIHFIAHVSTHSRLKAAVIFSFPIVINMNVSTHSRLKAAETMYYLGIDVSKFQHTAA